MNFKVEFNECNTFSKTVIKKNKISHINFSPVKKIYI